MEWYILAFISAILSAIAAIAEKKSLFKVKALEFSAILSVFTFIFAVPFLFLFSMSAVTSQALIVLFIKSIFNAIAFYCVMEALKRLDISNSLPLMNLSPGLVAIVALIFLKEVLSLWQSAGLILLMIGTYILNSEKNKSLLEPFMILFKSKNYHFILVALAAFTITSVLDKVLVGNFKMPPEGFIFFQQLFTMLLFCSTFIILRKGETIKITKESMKAAGYLIVFVGLLGIGYRYTQILAVKTGKVALVLAIKRLSIFFACLIGGTLFKEKNLLMRISATTILIIGVIMVVNF